MKNIIFSLKKIYWKLLGKFSKKRIEVYLSNTKLLHNFGKWYCQTISRKEYESQSFRKINERPIEYRFVFQSLLRTCPTTLLDVGTGTTALPNVIKTCGFVVTSIDNIYDYWPKGMFNRHFHVIHDDITKTKITKKVDFITCVSVLEHIHNFHAAVNSMFSLLNIGGFLVLTFPYNEKKYIRNVYKLPEAGYGQDAPYACQVFSRKEINKWLKLNNGIILEQEYWEVFAGDFWTFGQHLYPPRQVEKHHKHHLTCLLIQKIQR